MEVLYGAMSDGEKRLTVREFFHCYRPDEIDKSRGIYSFVPRSPLLKVIYDTPDSNRDWKSRYFFLEGDGWMGRPGDTDFMPVDITWGILHPSSMDCPSNFNFIKFVEYNLTVLYLLLQLDDAPKLTLRSLLSLRKFSQRPSRRKGLGRSW